VKTVLFFSAFVLGTLLSILIFSSFWIFQIDREWAPLIEPRIKERQEIGSIRILAENSAGEKQWIASLTSGRLEVKRVCALQGVQRLMKQSIVFLRQSFLREFE
jgi:hypothetical protein